MSSSSRNATKRLARELETWRSEAAEETGIERLGPIDESDLLTWEAVINGRGLGAGYDGAFSPSPTHTHSLYIFMIPNTN